MSAPAYLGEERLRTYFIKHLNIVFCAKSHLIERLPELAESANFKDLRNAVIETLEDVEKQRLRMDEIFHLLEVPSGPKPSQGIESILEEAFIDVNECENDNALRDMAILFYLQIIESMEMASFQVLRMAAVKFRNPKISQLLQMNFDEAKEDRALMLLITAKYLAG